jgi:excisionase family DNA binding protein
MKLDKLNYSKKEAAEIVGISVHTVTRDVRLGRIHAKRYGRRVLISRDEIVRIASDGMRDAPADRS